MNRTSIRGVKKLMEKLNAGWTLSANPKSKIAFIFDPSHSPRYREDCTVNWPALAAAEKRGLIRVPPYRNSVNDWIDYEVVKQ